MPPPFDLDTVRAQFPALSRRINGQSLAYLDSASTSQKPRAVVQAVVHALENAANIHRGVHTLSVEATDAFEAARGKTARFMGAADPRSVVFVRGTTEAINLVAQTYGRIHVGPGDEVLITALEHHANLVPWQALCAEKGAHLRVLPMDARGVVELSALDQQLTSRTRLLACAHVSNSLGTRLPLREIIQRAHARGAVVLVDGAQAIAHLPVDVQALDCDFYAFSAHKMYGPTGAGVLYAKPAILNALPPWQHGGDMISRVTFEKTSYREAPQRFEAGTPDIVGVIGLGAAIDWLSAIGMDAIAEREQAVTEYALFALQTVPGLRLIGTSPERNAVVSFLLDDIHPHDVGTALDLEGIAVRTGQHCAEPVMDHFGVAATIRASFGIYTAEAEIDRLVEALHRARALFGAP